MADGALQVVGFGFILLRQGGGVVVDFGDVRCHQLGVDLRKEVTCVVLAGWVRVTIWVLAHTNTIVPTGRPNTSLARFPGNLAGVGPNRHEISSAKNDAGRPVDCLTAVREGYALSMASRKAPSTSITDAGFALGPIMPMRHTVEAN